MTNEYSKYDSCYGHITGRCQSGAYLTLDNGQLAFAYRMAGLRNGTKVFCSVMKKAAEGRRMLVNVEGVMNYAR